MRETGDWSERETGMETKVKYAQEKSRARDEDKAEAEETKIRETGGPEKERQS